MSPTDGPSDSAKGGQRLERERMRERERLPEPISYYEHFLQHWKEVRARNRTGKYVVKASERNWDRTRQGEIKYYLHPQLIDDTALQDWQVFVHNIYKHSGKHLHQGGLLIFVLEGSGYTVVNGQREEWKAGDLLLLPIKPGGVEHQHFNHDPMKPAKWLAFVYWPFHDQLASTAEQIEDAPGFGGR